MTPRDILAISHIAAIDGPKDWPYWDWAKKLLIKNRDAAHAGDCTKQAETCPRCLVDEAYQGADLTIAALAVEGYAITSDAR